MSNYAKSRSKGMLLKEKFLKIPNNEIIDIHVHYDILKSWDNRGKIITVKEIVL